MRRGACRGGLGILSIAGFRGCQGDALRRFPLRGLLESGRRDAKVLGRTAAEAPNAWRQVMTASKDDERTRAALQSRFHLPIVASLHRGPLYPDLPSGGDRSRFVEESIVVERAHIDFASNG